MAEQHSERSETSERLIEQSMSQNPSDWPRKHGVDRIKNGHLIALKRSIETLVQAELSTSVRAVYVVGSFARGEAKELVSDLDLRVVIRSPLPDEETASFEHDLENEYGPALCPKACGSLDPHLTILEPGDETPHVEIAHG